MCDTLEKAVERSITLVNSACLTSCYGCPVATECPRDAARCRSIRLMYAKGETIEFNKTRPSSPEPPNEDTSSLIRLGGTWFKLQDSAKHGWLHWNGAIWQDVECIERACLLKTIVERNALRLQVQQLQRQEGEVCEPQSTPKE